MNRIGTLLVMMVLCAAFTSKAQTYRTYTGWGNNLSHPYWGMNGDTVVERNSPAYGDGYSSPAGQNRQNPRRISNFLAAAPQSIPNTRNLSDFTWVFGQLLDHEFALVLDDAQQPFPIFVNFPDPHFNPGGVLPAVTISMHRSLTVPGTGTEPGNPRRFANNISAYFDGSSIYGSDSTWASWLRTFEDGKMKTSAGDLLPFNTITGEFEGDLDPAAPKMDNQNPFNKKLFVAGDIRVNENIFLTAMHTLFVREHNYQAGLIRRSHPEWNDEQIYQHARKIVSGILTAIAYEEWLPTLGVSVPPYQGYDPTVHPGMFNVFSAAGFRLGHTMLSTNLPRRDNLNQPVAQGDFILREAFFNPVQILNSGGVEPMLKGMAHQLQQEADHKVIDDVRNFLFGPPGAGGRDLIAINIQRGRERGLPDFNTIREEFGLPKYASFLEMLGDENQAMLFQTAFGHVDNIDAWIGLMAEAKEPGHVFGPTLNALLAEQFAHFRDGDRFYFENDPDLSDDEKARIKATRLYDVLMRNTGITILQKNVFLMEEHSAMCAATDLAANLTGETLAWPDDEALEQVHIAMHIDYKDPLETETDANGTFQFEEVQTCRKYHAHPDLEDSWTNGISIADIVLLRKHLVGTAPFQAPHAHFAADVDESGSVSIADMYDIRRLLLGKVDAFEGTGPWLFFDDAYDFQQPDAPLDEREEAATIKVPVLESDHHFRIRGVKKGDLNGTAKLGLITSEVRSSDPLEFQFGDQMIHPGQAFDLPFASTNIEDFAGFQMTLQYPVDKVRFEGASSGSVELTDGISFTHLPEKGLVVLVVEWQDPLVNNTPLFHLSFTALHRLHTRDVVRITSQFLDKEAVTASLDVADISLRFRNDVHDEEVLAPFQVFGNQPNPFRDGTIISFDLPESGDVSVVVYDLNGRALLNKSRYFHRGFNQLSVGKDELQGATGILIYQLHCASGTFSDRMLLQD